MQTFNFTPRGHLSIPGNQSDLVIVIGGRPDANYNQKQNVLLSLHLLELLMWAIPETK